MKWTDCPLIEQAPGVMSGAPVLRGSRVRAEDIIANYDEGAEGIAAMFWLPLDDVRAVLAFWEGHGSELPLEYFPPEMIREMGADIEWTGCPCVTVIGDAGPTIGATNVRPIDLVANREEGDEWLVRSYGLPLKTIRAVLDFFDAHERHLARAA